jgi:hypothetical protein
MGASAMSRESSGPGTLSGLTRRTPLRRSASLIGGAALASLLDACTVAPAAPPAVSTPTATKLVLLDAANMDTPEAAPRKQVVSARRRSSAWSWMPKYTRPRMPASARRSNCATGLTAHRQAEKTLCEHGDRLPEQLRAELAEKSSAVKRALEPNDVDAMRPAIDVLKRTDGKR